MYISTDSAAILTNILINTYFKNFYCSVVITDTKLSLKNTDVPLLFFETKNRNDFPFLFEVMDKGCHGYVLKIKDLYRFFTKFENTTLYINHRYGRKRFIVLPTDEDDFSLNNFSYDWVKHIPDVIFLKTIGIDTQHSFKLQRGPNNKQQSETIAVVNQQSGTITVNNQQSEAITIYTLQSVRFKSADRQLSEAIDRKKSDILSETIDIEKSIPTGQYGIFSREKLVNIEIYSFNYVGTENMKDLVLRDIWFGENQTFQWKADLFPDKMRDLKGRTLRLSLFNYKPSSLWWEDEEGVHLDGTEARIAIQYCKWVNCNIELVHYEEDLEWGELFENKTGSGMLGNVYHDRADVAFSSSCMWFHEYTFLDLSAPYIRTGITVIAPRLKLINDFLFPFLPFKMNIWILHNIVLLLATILLYIYCTMEWTNQTQAKLLKKADNFKEKPTDGSALGTINNNPINEANETTIYRVKGKKRFDSNANSFKDGSFIYNMMGSHLSILDILYLQGGGFGGGRRGLALRSAMLFYALFVCNAYVCGLTSTMTRARYSAPLDSVRDLATHGTLWGATHDAWIFSIRSATEKDIITVRNNFVNMPPKELAKQWKRDDFAYGVERLQHGNFATADYITTDNVNLRRLMGGDIYWDWYIAMFRKSSPFRVRYDTLIWRLHQTGLMKAWENQVVSKYLNYAVQQAVIRSRDLPPSLPTVLGLHHMQGALLLWGTMLTGALFTFLLELAVHAQRRLV